MQSFVARVRRRACPVKGQLTLVRQRGSVQALCVPRPFVVQVVTDLDTRATRILDVRFTGEPEVSSSGPHIIQTAGWVTLCHT